MGYFKDTAIGSEEAAKLNECVAKGGIAQGEYVKEFEEVFRQYCGTKFASATMNGTAALHLALKALGVGPGDEVIVPSLTFIATANAVVYCGAKPVFADVDPTTLNIDGGSVGKRVTRRTKGIIPVHLYGNPADMDSLNDLAEERSLFVIEDAAEAHGAVYKGKKVGSLSDISCFSFYANKIITTGEGGMCLTNRKAYKEEIDILRAQGKKKRSEIKDPKEYAQEQFHHTKLAFNYRMTNLQAAVGIPQVQRLDDTIKRKRQIGKLYEERLGGHPPITLVEQKKGIRGVYWMFPVILPDERTQLRVVKALCKESIDLRSFFYPLHLHEFYRSDSSLPVSENLFRRSVLLPTDLDLTPQDIERICNIITGAL